MGILSDDRTGTTLAERFQAFGDAIQRTTERLGDRAKRIGNHVRGYIERKYHNRAPSAGLERAGQRLVEAGRNLERTTPKLQKALTSAKNQEQEYDGPSR